MVTITLDRGPQATAVLNFRPDSDRNTPRGEAMQAGADLINGLLAGKQLGIVDLAEVEEVADPKEISRPARLLQIQAELTALGIDMKLPLGKALVDDMHQKEKALASSKPAPKPAAPKDPLAGLDLGPGNKSPTLSGGSATPAASKETVGDKVPESHKDEGGQGETEPQGGEGAKPEGK